MTNAAQSSKKSCKSRSIIATRIMLFVSLLAFILTPLPSLMAKTSDGIIPKQETICEDAGLERNLLGLCRAYAEANDCNDIAGLENTPRCIALAINFERASGGIKITDVLSPNTPPVADAGHSFSAPINTPVFLDGRASYDPDGDDLLYSWSVVTVPEDAKSSLFTPSASVSRFVANKEGAYTLSLSVSDGRDSATDQVVIFVDLDGDGAVGATDEDIDGDGVFNEEDLFPEDPGEFDDTDNDGIGNFAQKDEDGDLVVDGLDQFPFDPTRRNYPITVDTEFNDNPADANNTGATYPLRIIGTISKDIDSDYFRFFGSAGDLITAVLYRSNSSFKPALSIIDIYGRPLQAVRPNVDEGRPFDEAITVIIPNDGQFLLVVNEFNSAGAPDFKYVVDIFRDADIDGLDDTRELALGINPLSADGEGDGIYDSSETPLSLGGSTYLTPRVHLTEADIDNDGRPNWLDPDTDGDWISDRIEGATDADNDDIPNFADIDSDNNGIGDAEEGSLNAGIPIDTDGDGIPDFLDTDDDQDGLLDQNDEDPLGPIAAANPLVLKERIIIRGLYGIIDGEKISGATRKRDLLLIEGTNFGAVPEENTVIFSNGKNSYNVTPQTALPGLLEVIVPDGSFDEVAVVTCGLSSNREQIKLLSDDSPVLFSPDSAFATIGDQLTLYGLNLYGPININFGGVIINGIGSSDGMSVQAVVPANAMSGEVAAITAAGFSNEIQLFIEKEVPATIVIPTSVPVNPEDLVVDFGWVGETTPSTSGRFLTKINNSAPQVVSAYLPETNTQPAVTLLDAYTLPSDNNVELSFLSTAVYHLMIALYASSRASEDYLAIVRSKFSTLPEVERLVQEMVTAAASDPYFQANPPTGALLNAWFEALLAADQVLTEITTAQSVSFLEAAAFTMASAEAQVTITPLEQYDVKVTQRPEPNHGNISVENDTMLYLSTKIVDSENGSALHPHISGPYERILVPPQALGLLFNAGTQNYEHPNFRDSKAEIITPGRGTPGVSGTTYNCLLARTLIDGAVLPVVTEIIGSKLKGKDLWNILNKHAPNILNEAITDFSEGNAKGAVSRIARTIVDDFLKPGGGPIARAIVTKLGGQKLIETIVKKIVIKLGARFLPVVGWIITGFDVTDFGIPLIKLSKDILETPGRLDFQIDFPLEVEDVRPASIRVSEKDIEVTINGSGFAPITSGFFSKSTVYPEVIFSDEANDRKITVKGTPDSFGTSLTAMLPGSFRAMAEGPICVEVSHGGNQKEAKNKIEIAVLHIDELVPDRGGPGSEVTIRGAGFSENPFENIVYFEGKNGRSLALVYMSSESELKVIAPPEVITGEVSVEVETKASNGVLFTADLVAVLISFGDNGLANDDTFALFVDGEMIRAMSSPSRRVVAKLDLEPGRHDVVLRGITAHGLYRYLLYSF